VGTLSGFLVVEVSAECEEVKDQYQENCEHCEHVDTYWNSWQEFVPTANCLSKVEVKILRYNAYPNEYPITMTIESPPGNVLTSATLPWTAVPEGPFLDPCEAVWISFDLPDIVLTPGQSYYINLTAYPLAYLWCFASWDAYPAGQGGDTSAIGSDSDWTFRTFGTIPAVGGVVIPVDKFGLLAPYIGVASTILVATAATAIYVKRVKRRKKKQ
jgi:hypothetical protein